MSESPTFPRPHPNAFSPSELGRMYAMQDYQYGVVKLDRRLDPYLGQIITHDGRCYSGLFPSKARALSWCKEKIRQNYAHDAPSDAI